MAPEKYVCMDVERVLHMKDGIGEASYAQNSRLQKKGIEAFKHIVIKTATELYTSETLQTLTIADLGCSSGPNSLSMVKSILKAINRSCQATSKPPPEFMVFLNDLPTNDFNTVFKSVPDFVMELKDCRGHSLSVLMAGVPGSFYGRLFPKNGLHFISSSYSLHWLSQVPSGLFDERGVPINKGKMYISETSPAAVAESYLRQFQRDFSRRFLKSRSEELFNGGRMVLGMLGRKTDDHFDKSNTFLWEVLAQSFAIMVRQGMVEEEKVDSYNVPFYAPSMKEIEDVVKKEGSFVIDYIQVDDLSLRTEDADKDAAITAMAIRAIQESMIAHHFGEEIVETLFQYYKDLLCNAMAQEEIHSTHLVVVLRKVS